MDYLLTGKKHLIKFLLKFSNVGGNWEKAKKEKAQP